MITLISSQISLFAASLFQKDSAPLMRNKQPANTAAVLAVCQMCAAHLTCIKHALSLECADEVNPGKCHYTPPICLIKPVLITEEEVEMKQRDFGAICWGGPHKNVNNIYIYKD